MYDAMIVEAGRGGTGPAGPNAAHWVGRRQRQLLAYARGRPRRAAIHAVPAVSAVPGLLPRDGIVPATCLRLGREQLPYPAVDYRQGKLPAFMKEAGFAAQEAAPPSNGACTASWGESIPSEEA
jgi:hypothetical protein